MQGREREERRGRPPYPSEDAAAREGEGRTGAGHGVARSLQRREEDDRDGFAPSPLEPLFFFYSSPFPFLFSVYYLNTAVKHYFEASNKIRKM